jgi:proteasome accessory factor B
MPPSRLTDKEAFGLLLLIRKAEALMELPFNAAIQRAAIKIRNALPSDIRLMCRRKLNNISIRSTGKKQKSLDKCFEALQQAIQKRKILSITYCSKYEDEIITADFSPFHLIYTNEWYVMGKINISRQIQSIKLKSIKKIEETKRCFLNEEEFDPSYYIGRAWATIPEGRLYNIQLKFASEIAQDVTSVKWHDTQYAMVEEDGSAIMEFRVDGLNEITWWILGFGDKVEVLKPEVLRKKIHEIAEKMVQKT